MGELQKQVRRAQRRLGLQQFVGALGWCLSATLLAAVVLIAVDRFRPLGVAAWIWAAAGLGLGLAIAAVRTVVSWPAPLDAAIEIDRRFELKERVSSTLALDLAQQQSEAGQALITDTVRRVRRIDVTARFGVAPGRQILLPLVPGLLALLAAVLVSPRAVENAAARAEPPAATEQVKKSSEALGRKLEDGRKLAQKQGLEDAERLLKKLEEGSKELAAGQTDRKQALVKLNDLTQELKQRRAQVGGADRVAQQLNQLKNVAKGPADKFSQAVGRGNFKQAVEELKKLQEELAQGKLSDQQRGELAQQLAQMQQKLQELVDAHQAAQKDLQKQIDTLRQAGQAAEADKLQQQIDKLLEQLPQVQQLDKLAEKLGQCSKCLRDGRLQDAAGAISDAQGRLEDLQKQLDELQMLDGAMEQLALAREQMNCPHCGGAGCDACQGNRPGFGMGPAQGQGDRPEEKTDTAFYDSQVKQQVGRGSATVADMVEGPNVKGNVQQQIEKQSDAARHGLQDPLTDQRMPREHRQHAREYFDRLRKGE